MMETAVTETPQSPVKESPRCPAFGACGGCVYQDIPYSEELQIKETALRDLLMRRLSLEPHLLEAIVPSPEFYRYRHRLDVGLYKRGSGEFQMGFMQEGRRKVVEIQSCALARTEISDFLPQLKAEASGKFPPGYRTANLVVKTGDDGRVAWGGIGRRSLRMTPENYFWTDVGGVKIFYSLESFFQANLSILPVIISWIKNHVPVERDSVFFDLYAGVGLFGICLAERAGRVVMIEDASGSVECAKFNAAFHQKEKVIEVHEGKVEYLFPDLLKAGTFGKKIALVDPPRKGLNDTALFVLKQAARGGLPEVQSSGLDKLLYLSCSPESLADDLVQLTEKAWQIEKVVPFDFFPRTRHLETLVVLRPKGGSL